MNASPGKDRGRKPPPRHEDAPARRPAPLIMVWLALMLLLAITVATSFIPLGAANAVLNIGIAVAKTLLVGVSFMHLGRAPAILRLIAIVGLITLCLLFVLGGADYLSRSTVPSAWQKAVPSLQAAP